MLSHKSNESSLPHLSQLDGLRGLAIFLVIVGHVELINGPFITPNYFDSASSFENAFWFCCKFGWIGVDLFFVLSGFLITCIVIRQVNSSQNYLIFFFRRFLRIYPLFAVSLGAYFFALHFIDIEKMVGSKYSCYVENQWLMWFQLTNFMRENGIYPQGELAHFWSLAIEEQFYFLMPFLFLCLRKIFKEKFSSIFVLGIILLIALIYTLKIFHIKAAVDYAENIYVSSIFRGEPILWGSILAFAYTYSKEKFQSYSPFIGTLLLLLGATLFVFSIFCAHKQISIRSFDMNFTGYRTHIQSFGFHGVSIFFSGLLMLALSMPKNKRFIKLLNSKLLRLLGKYSYSIYIFNTLIIAALTAGGFSWFFLRSAFSSYFLPCYFLLIIFLCLMIAAATWHTIEKFFFFIKGRKYLAYVDNQDN
ncbi:MAG: acyltransferase [Myxococcales bacterium]|nr:MAG: acyltransferase [Myxococcales bacterium]